MASQPNEALNMKYVALALAIVISAPTFANPDMETRIGDLEYKVSQLERANTTRATPPNISQDAFCERLELGNAARAANTVGDWTAPELPLFCK